MEPTTPAHRTVADRPGCAAQVSHFESWRAGHITFEEQRRRRLRDFLPLIGRGVGSDAELDLLFAGYLAEYEAARQAFDDVGPVLALLTARGVTVAVLSNGTVAQQNAKVATIGIRDRLTAVITSEELGVAKPHPDMHVGDRHDMDVLAAREAGLQALHLDRHDKRQVPPVDRMLSLNELPARLTQPTSISLP